MWLLVVFLSLGGGIKEVSAQIRQPVPLEVEIQAPPMVRLTLSPNQITFPDADPEATPEIPATENPVRVLILVRATTLVLLARATTQLTSGLDKIDITNVSWTASGSGFLNGSLRYQQDVEVGKWLHPPNRLQGALTFLLRNRWNYPVGNYTATVIFTATAL